MSKDDLNLDADSLEAEELSDAELTDVQGAGGFPYFSYGEEITQVQEQIAIGNVDSVVIQNAKQTAF